MPPLAGRRPAARRIAAALLERGGDALALGVRAVRGRGATATGATVDRAPAAGPDAAQAAPAATPTATQAAPGATPTAVQAVRRAAAAEEAAPGATPTAAQAARRAAAAEEAAPGATPTAAHAARRAAAAEEAAARLDAARERLRATIAAPDDDEGPSAPPPAT